MTDKKFPSPEEIQSEFEEFVQGKFGGNVKVHSHVAGNPIGNIHDMGNIEQADDIEDLQNEDILEDISSFNMKPKQVKEHLDRFVIKQDEAKKALAIAVCDHYNHVKQCINGAVDPDEEYSKQNVLILGPTGVGKTYLVKQIAKLIGVPFVKADATKFTETGYVGANVDDMVKDLVSQANDNLDLAQYGIIYIDEVDKLASSGGNFGGKDISGRGVQSTLLKLMEETDIDLASGNDMRSQMEAFMDMQNSGKMKKKIINTKHILFIVSGAFGNIEDIIKSRLNLKDIGFAASTNRVLSSDDTMSQTTTEDLIQYGFEPEFVGRLPIRVACQHLDSSDLATILKKSEGSIIRQYENAFKAYDVDLMFADAALDAIAKKAHKEKTGARALMTICEETLRSYKFEIPSSNIKEVLVTEPVVNNPEKELHDLLNNPEYDRHLARMKSISKFENDFQKIHGMGIEFSDAAATKICELVIKSNNSINDLCLEMLTSYEHGLKLVQQNTGQSKFNLGLDVVETPQFALEKLIQESYNLKNAQSNPSSH
jgi:ATP-dependent Clp protease ATP-binding subunit ClpX